MAARSEPCLPELVELSSLTVHEFELLVEEEIVAWREQFDWDFKPSADLLRRFLQMRSLSGYALRIDNTVIGYSYYVVEGRKGLIGDFYVRRAYPDASYEMMLLGATVQGVMLVSGVHRIESQLLLLHAPLTQSLPFHRSLKRYDRYFMEVSRSAAQALEPKPLGFRAELVPWTERLSEEIAHLVTYAYRGHVDSEINDQYRTIPGARHFLMNIIQYPGCGRFSPKASIVALDSSSGKVCGVCLASMVSETAGHVTQLCVLPGVRGARLGYELLRNSLERLTALGCRSVSLTVTCSNLEAIRLYESVGFRATSVFPALVWEGF
ncbi:MAG TPA: GNAT family N-acetyltransferase [Bryobacteraceae bacterium]|nr:GNAT family N-acetyltransferase [Bryobacteraceae bacterium]